MLTLITTAPKRPNDAGKPRRMIRHVESTSGKIVTLKTFADAAGISYHSLLYRISAAAIGDERESYHFNRIVRLMLQRARARSTKVVCPTCNGRGRIDPPASIEDPKS